MLGKYLKSLENAIVKVANHTQSKHPSEKKIENVVQFIKFSLVGIINNVICYISYIVLVRIGIHYQISNIIGFSLSVLNAHYWNNKYVFNTGEKRNWWPTFVKTYLSYAGTGLVLANFLLYVWIEMVGIPVTLAPIINLVITVPINFLLNKLWAYRDDIHKDVVNDYSMTEETKRQ